jgi:hypothetical protein
MELKFTPFPYLEQSVKVGIFHQEHNFLPTRTKLNWVFFPGSNSLGRKGQFSGRIILQVMIIKKIS